MLPHDELYHYGKKGMRWGVRNAVAKAYGRKAASRQASADRARVDQKRAVKLTEKAFNPKINRAQRSANEAAKISKMAAKAQKIKEKRMSKMTPEQRKLHNRRLTLLAENATMSAANLYMGTRSDNPLRTFNTVVGVANTAAAGKMAYDLYKE